MRSRHSDWLWDSNFFFSLKFEFCSPPSCLGLDSVGHVQSSRSKMEWYVSECYWLDFFLYLNDLHFEESLIPKTKELGHSHVNLQFSTCLSSCCPWVSLQRDSEGQRKMHFWTDRGFWMCRRRRESRRSMLLTGINLNSFVLYLIRNLN